LYEFGGTPVLGKDKRLMVNITTTTMYMYMQL